MNASPLRNRGLGLFLVFLAVAAAGWASPQQPHQHAPEPPPIPAPGLPAFTVEELERRALEHNPALAQADAAVRAVEARRLQAGLWPDPVVGYSGEEIPLEEDGDGRHGFFVAMDIPLGGKLRLQRQVLAQELEQAGNRAEAERLRLLGQVRVLAYRTLAAQERVKVRERLAALGKEAVEVTRQLFNTGAADAPDQLAIENEADLLESSLLDARIELDQLWTALRAAVADPGLEPGVIAGDLAAGLPDLDRTEWRDRLLAQSPEMKVARAESAKAEAVLARARAARVPDLTFEGGVRWSREPVRPGGPEAGREGFADVGVRLPLFNRNQGGIAAAEADLARARLQEERTRLSLEARFAERYGRYRQAAERVRTLRERVLGRARRAHEQYLDRYGRMMAAYPQVLIAQRTLFQLEDGYIDVLGRAWGEAAAIQSLLLSEPEGVWSGDGGRETSELELGGELEP